ncbi:hypothetical protein [Winogradskyella sp. 3972H.M.0a.05]|uniref:hypothetical protein n=1 Tax=Winogradskyella sp. 3972H.M.0a.05 TaxID=2950277 RepID=UPI0033992BB0
MKRLKNCAILILSCVIFTSCDDVFEEDITGDIVQIISPTSGQVIQGNTVVFSWQELDGADDYRIQVINDAQLNVVDSLVTNITSIDFILDPGNYNWRIKGENFAYETQYNFPVSFSVEASDDLTNQSVSLLTPTEGFYTNDPNIIFTWNAISTAEDYTVEIIKNLNGLQTVLQQQGITNENLAVNASVFDEDAEYMWKVKAVNSTSETPFSERSLFVDRVQPNQPALNTPLDNELLDDVTVTFNWVNGLDTGNIQSEISNTIEISTDINFSTIIHTDTTTNNTYQYTFDASGIYYWRVKAVDLAQNESDFSISRTLEIQ